MSKEQEASWAEKTTVKIGEYGGLIGGVFGLLNGDWAVAIAGGAIAFVAHVIGQSRKGKNS